MFDTLYTPLCLFAHKYLENIEDSRDVVQDVFLKIWQKKIVFQDKTAIKAYLYRAVRNKCLDFLKSSYSQKQKQRLGLDIKQLEDDSFFAREVLLTETSEIIENALNTLSLKYRKVIKLAMDGLSNEQIAEHLQVSINTIKSQKKFAYKKLRIVLKNDVFHIFMLLIL